jgi:type IV secretion system protein VirD4
MNKIYEQWKKVLASPALLLSISVSSLILLYISLSLILNIVYAIIGFFAYLFHYGWYGFGVVLSYTVQRFTTGIFGQLYLHSKYPTFERIVFTFAYSFLIYRLIKRIYKMRIAYRDINKGTKGTSRWMQEKEIERTYEKFDIYSSEPQLEHGGYPVAMSADRRYMYVEIDKTNSKAVGTSQAARKTQLFFYWLLYLNIMAKNPDSQLINDLKGDMLMKFLGSPGKDRFDTYALNFIQPLNSIKYNPFTVVWKYAQLEQLDDAEIALAGIGKQFFSRAEVSKDPDFIEGANATFTAIVLVLLEFAQEYNRPQWLSLAGLYDLVLTHNKTIVTEEGAEYKPLDEYMKRQPSTSRIAKHYMTATNATKKQIQSFYFLLSTTLKDFALNSILEMTSSSDLDFEQMAFPDEGQKPIIVFVSFPYVNNIFEKIQGLFYSQMIDVLTKKAQLSPGQKFKRRVRLGIDEAQNSPRIESLSEATNVGQQVGLLVSLGIQSYAGFAAKYPDKEGEAILSGTPGLLYLISDDPEDAKKMSERLGDATYVAYNRIGDPLAIDKSITEMEEERKLMKPDEVMRVAQNEAIYMNVKKRTDLEGKDVVPNPIYARKKRTNKMRNVPGEPLWKKVLGFAKQEEETVFESYMELLPAFEHLFKDKEHEFFDDHGLGISDVDLRKNVKLDEYGNEIPFNIEEYMVPHELVSIKITLQMNQENPDFSPMEKHKLERRLEQLKKEILDGTYYQKEKPSEPVDDSMPQDLSEEYTGEPLVVPENQTSETNEEEFAADFSTTMLVTQALGARYDELSQFMSSDQWQYFKQNFKTLGELNDNILISEKLSDENKSGIIKLLEETYATQGRGTNGK